MITLINRDCIYAMEDMELDSIDMIFTDPPYAISNKNNNGNTWNGYRSEKGSWDYIHGNYDQFTYQWIEWAYKLLRPGGIICISGVLGSLVPAFIKLESLKATFQSHFIWHKTNPTPSVHRRMFTHANEIVLIYSKGNKWKFNYEAVKALNGGKQQHNVINLAAQRKINDTIKKPDKLLELLITAFTDEGDTILDPFLGTGTTVWVADKMSRNGIGIEKDDSMFEYLQNKLLLMGEKSGSSV